MDKKESPLTDEELADLERYEKAAHGMQSGVALKMQIDGTETTPKHLRVGVNSAMVDTGALIGLLIEKGVFTRAEWFKAMADAHEREKASYEKWLSEHYGKKVTLG